MYATIRLFLIGILFTFSLNTFAQHEEKEFNPGDLILHHIADSHEWHFATIGDSHITLPLPIILYTDNGIDVFSSSEFHHAEKKEITNQKGEKEHALVLKREKGTYVMTHDHITLENGGKLYDFSITKNVASLLISAVLLLVVFFSVAKAYKVNAGKAPKGIQSFFEPIIVFIRDEIAIPNIGSKHERFMPYLLTVFFFIWFNNLLGLMPGGANVTGNIAVTLTLALLTLIITLASSNKYYWQHILNTPGVPWWLKFLIPIMPVVELVGIFTKPFSLMVRLFANITAGHIIILSLLSLIFLFKSYAVAPVSVAFAVIMNCLELFVAILQAYVFTLLSAMYFGGAVEEHHHEEHEHHDGKHEVHHA
jgi:F-type H+-transporting ATPase subunit a